jgi:hypothetical protein
VLYYTHYITIHELGSYHDYDQLEEPSKAHDMKRTVPLELVTNSQTVEQKDRISFSKSISCPSKFFFLPDDHDMSFGKRNDHAYISSTNRDRNSQDWCLHTRYKEEARRSLSVTTMSTVPAYPAISTKESLLCLLHSRLIFRATIIRPTFSGSTG